MNLTTTLVEDSQGVLWIGTANGIAFLSSDLISILRTAPESLRAQIFGIAEDKVRLSSRVIPGYHDVGIRTHSKVVAKKH